MTETAHAHPRPYGRIFLALLVLTIVEIGIAGLPIPKLAIVLGLLTFAIAKAALVAMFYMHLKFEKVLLTLVALAPLIFSLIFTLMIGWDIWYPMGSGNP
jgi:cytochrome c oxidase subunit IV